MTHYPSLGPILKMLGIEDGASELLFIPLIRPGVFPTLCCFEAHGKSS